MDVMSIEFFLCSVIPRCIYFTDVKPTSYITAKYKSFSKADSRKNTVRKNLKMSPAIVINTPERNKLEERTANASQKRRNVKKMIAKKSIKALA